MNRLLHASKCGAAGGYLVKFPDGAGVRPQKIAELKERIARLGVNLAGIDEKFVSGGGHGGQKINRSRNCVQLKLDGVVVRCQKERSLSLNRFIALRELVDRVEMKISPETSSRLAENARIRKAKSTCHNRAVKKLHFRDYAVEPRNADNDDCPQEPDLP